MAASVSCVRSRSLKLLNHDAYQTEKLHHTFVLSQVFVALEKEHVGPAVASTNAEFAGSLFRRDHLQKMGCFVSV